FVGIFPKKLGHLLHAFGSWRLDVALLHLREICRTNADQLRELSQAMAFLNALFAEGMAKRFLGLAHNCSLADCLRLLLPARCIPGCAGCYQKCGRGSGHVDAEFFLPRAIFRTSFAFTVLIPEPIPKPGH